MAETTRTDSEVLTCSTEQAGLAREFVAFVKAAFVYPPNHSRVIESRDRFLAGCTALVQRSGQPFVLENRAAGLHAGGGRVPAFALADWCRDNLHKAMIGSIRCDAELTADALQGFATRLRQTCSGKIDKTASFTSLWFGCRFAGLEIAELRFFGGFHDLDLGSGTGTDSLRTTVTATSAELESVLRRLGCDEPMLQRMHGIEQRLAAATPYDAGGAALSLPRELLAALPADVVADPASRPQFLGRLLDEFETLLQQEERAPAPGEEDAGALIHLFRKVAQGFFGSRLLPADDERGGRLPAAPSRPEDRIDDLEDPRQLLPLVQALPQTVQRLDPDPAVLQAEVLNICLRQLGDHADDRLVAAVVQRLKVILARAAPPAVRVLDQYVRKVLDPSANALSPQAAANVLQRLGDHELLGTVRRQGALEPGLVARHFPNAFVAFVDSLTEGAVGDAELLQRVLAEIDEAALGSGTAQLLQQAQLLQPARLRKLLQLGGRQALGIARHLLRGDDRSVQAEVLALLRRLGSRRPEALPLQFIELERLPPWYLQLLCDLERTGKFDARLRDHAGLLLRSYVESLAGDPARLAAKTEAISALLSFPGRATETLLLRLLRGRGFLGFLWVPRPVRQAAGAVLQQWRQG